EPAREPKAERSNEPKVERSNEPKAERSNKPKAERSNEPKAERSNEPVVEHDAGPLQRLREFVRELGIPRLLIAAFVVALFVVAAATHMGLASLMSDSLVRVARNGILVLALLPSVQGGLGLNFGLPLGIACGLLACVVTLNAGLGGWAGLAASAALGIVIAVPAGLAYGWLLN